MGTTQTTLFDPPVRRSNLEDPIKKYLFTIQQLHPLRAVDTTNGGYGETPPPAGVEATGQSNQNMEITYIKTSSDGNTFTLSGVEGGPYHLMAQYDVIKIKSDATNWWPVG